MDFIQSKIREVTCQLIKPRKYNYCQDALYKYLQSNPSLKCQHASVKNKRDENLDTIIIKNTTNRDCRTCIIYAHGLGSNKIQVLPLVQSLKSSDFHFCAFDFSGSGRSGGDFTTYGLRQQDDIIAILAWLDGMRQYSKYILWGRSMGGVAMILSQSKHINKKIQCIVLDSPFSSFQKVAVQIASRFTKIPEAIIKIGVEPIKQQMRKSYPQLDPFSLDILGAANKIQTRLMLIYSRGDSVVGFEHSRQISKFWKKNALQVQIQQDHNRQRKRETYRQALSFIEKSIEINEQSSKRSCSRGKKLEVSCKQNYHPNFRPRASIISSVNSEKNAMKSTGNEVLPSIGSFVSCSSRELNKNQYPKQVHIKSLLLQSVQPRQSIRNSIKFTNNFKNHMHIL